MGNHNARSEASGQSADQWLVPVSPCSCASSRNARYTCSYADLLNRNLQYSHQPRNVVIRYHKKVDVSYPKTNDNLFSAAL
jgi:hypothetical protein